MNSVICGGLWGVNGSIVRRPHLILIFSDVRTPLISWQGYSRFLHSKIKTLWNCSGFYWPSRLHELGKVLVQENANSEKQKQTKMNWAKENDPNNWRARTRNPPKSPSPNDEEFMNLCCNLGAQKCMLLKMQCIILTASLTLQHNCMHIVNKWENKGHCTLNKWNTYQRWRITKHTMQSSNKSKNNQLGNGHKLLMYVSLFKETTHLMKVMIHFWLAQPSELLNFGKK